MAVIQGTADLLITCDYNDDAGGATPGVDWCILHDNPVMAWTIDETGAAPPVPIILGSMPLEVTAPDPILSPLWAVRDGSTIYVPDTVRGDANTFFNFIATNNGAMRKLYADFADVNMAVAFKEWSTVNPTLALTEPPNIAPDDAALESQRFGGMTDIRPIKVRHEEAAARNAERKTKEAAEAEQQPAR